SARVLPRRRATRLALTAPAPIRPYSGWNPDSRDILDPELFDSIPKACRFFKFEFSRRVAHALFERGDVFLALGRRQGFVRLLRLFGHRDVVAFRHPDEHHVDGLDDRLRGDGVFHVVSNLRYAAPVGFVDGALYAV